MTDTQTHYRTCNICEAMCGLEIQHRGNEILSIKGDNNDPFSRGHICPKAVALQDFYNDKDRLKTPMKRTADGWQEISWDEAFEEIASRFRAIQQEHGQDAVGVYLGWKRNRLAMGRPLQRDRHLLREPLWVVAPRSVGG